MENESNEPKHIKVRGAKVHNLKNIDVEGMLRSRQPQESGRGAGFPLYLAGGGGGLSFLQSHEKSRIYQRGRHSEDLLAHGIFQL